jgi:hypothetical protein
MDPVRNPFAPGAGSQPPELAGRHDIIEGADIALQRVLQGRSARSQMLLGLRGTGKTVLLNKIQDLAERHGFVTSFIEAPEDESLAQLLYPRLHQALQRLSTIEGARAATHQALRALRGFASAFRIKIGDISISVDPEPGSADSGQLEVDLSDLFLRVGEAARAAGSGWTLLIDEVQHLEGKELAALIVAIHRATQRSLPVLFFGAGLPQLAALAGDAKPYAERLVDYPPVGALDGEAARAAIREPINEEGASIEGAAIDEIIRKTDRYPYFRRSGGIRRGTPRTFPPLRLPT